MRSSGHESSWRAPSPPLGGTPRPFVLFGVILSVACLCAAARWGLSHGILFSAAGLLILVHPPRFRQHRGWGILGIGWLVCGLFAYLPHTCTTGMWRDPLTTSGIGISTLITPQPIETAVILAQTAALGCVALWITGHGCSDSARASIVLAFVTMVGALCALDITLRHLEGVHPQQADFGFFPNRNHSACLLVMAAISALGLLVHGVRHRNPVEYLISGSLFIFFLGCLFTRSSSRAGVLLLVPSVVLWIFLLGRSQLRGNSGKACLLLLLAASLGFLLSESAVKDRLSSTLRAVSGATVPWKNTAPFRDPTDAIDGRFSIAKDTFSMVLDAPWTGFGAGQFRYVFPQYRSPSHEMDGSEVLHPESSWLWIAAETGVPSAFFVFILGVWILITAARESRRPTSRCRALRCACVAAATVPMIHGFIDVSPHRAGILWSAALLASTALPLDRHRAGVSQSWAWRITGATILIFGCLLLLRHSIKRPLLPSEGTERLLRKAWSEYHRDTTTASVAATANRPPEDPDPLLLAIGQLNQATRLTPMDGRVHGLLGTLAVHFDDKDDFADHSFARQRDLNPAWIQLPLMQADVWKRIDPARVAILWKESIRRSREADVTLASPRFENEATDHIRKVLSATPSLQEAAKEAIGPAPFANGEESGPAN